MRDIKDDSAWAVGYAVALADEEIYCSRGFKPVITVEKVAAEVVESYHLSSADDQAEMAHLVGNFRPPDRPSDAVYDAVYEAKFGGDWPVNNYKKEFIVAFVAAAKRITGGIKEIDGAAGNKEAAAMEAEAKRAEADEAEDESEKAAAEKATAEKAAAK